jgi:hypothetical protein
MMTKEAFRFGGGDFFFGGSTLSESRTKSFKSVFPAAEEARSCINEIAKNRRNIVFIFYGDSGAPL